MSEDKKIKTSAPKTDVSAGAAATVAKDIYGGDKKRGGGQRGPRRGGREEKRDEFEQRILEIARVTRVWLVVKE